MTTQLDDTRTTSGRNTAVRHRMATRDRLLQGARILVAAGPIEVPTADEARRAVETIARADPARRFLRRYDHRGWLTPHDDDLTAAADAAVTELDLDGDFDDVTARIAALAEPGVSFRFFVGRSRFAVLIDHAASDGLLSSNTIPAVIAVARGAEVPPLFSMPGLDRPLLRALRATFGSPAKIRTLLRDARASVPATQSETEELEVEPLTPGSPAPLRSITRVMGRDDFQAFRAWGKVNGASFAATEAVAYHRAFTRVGGDMGPFVEFPVDLRRYLPSGGAAPGNFIAGQRLCVTEGIGRVVSDLDASLRSARPLAVAAYGVLRATLSPRRRSSRGEQRPGRPHLLVSSIGPVRTFEGLPWSAPVGERIVPVCVDVGDPARITFASLAVGGELHLSASFDPRLFDAERIAAVLDLIVAEGADLLSEPVDE